MDPKMAPKATPRAAQDTLGARWLPDTASGHVFGDFLAPRTLESHAPVQAGARFSQNQVFELGTEKGPQNQPQNDPKRPPDEQK